MTRLTSIEKPRLTKLDHESTKSGGYRHDLRRGEFDDAMVSEQREHNGRTY